MAEFLQHLGKNTFNLQRFKDNNKSIIIKNFPKDIVYLIDHENGIQLEVHNQVLKNVYLYGNHDKEFKPYKGELPYQLQFIMCNAHIVSKFGEPTRKEGGGPINIGISYDHLGIEITFQTKTWDQPNVAIDQMILYEPSSITTCGMCKQIGNLRCSQCKLVYYCGIKCQKEHWKQHKSFCQ